MAFKLSQSEDDNEFSAEINIIPLVDIMLVLLIIFMVAAPMMNDAVDVKLPNAKAKSADMKEQSVILSVKANQKVFIGKTEIPRDDLVQKLKSIFASRSQKDIFINADRDLSHGYVIQLMADIQRAGISKISFTTDPSAP